MSKEEKRSVASYSPVKVTEEKSVRTVEGFSSSLARSLASVADPEEEKQTRAQAEAEAQRGLEYMRQQYENQVLLNQQMAAQWQLIEKTQEENARMKERMEQLTAEVAVRPRASSLARWGFFHQKEQEDQEMSEEKPPATVHTHYSTGADLPVPPVFKGYSQSHKREFMCQKRLSRSTIAPWPRWPERL